MGRFPGWVRKKCSNVRNLPNCTSPHPSHPPLGRIFGGSSSNGGVGHLQGAVAGGGDHLLPRGGEGAAVDRRPVPDVGADLAARGDHRRPAAHRRLWGDRVGGRATPHSGMDKIVLEGCEGSPLLCGENKRYFFTRECCKFWFQKAMCCFDSRSSFKNIFPLYKDFKKKLILSRGKHERPGCRHPRVRCGTAGWD